MSNTLHHKSFHGLGVSPGLAFGNVHLVDRREFSIPKFHIGEQDVAHECERLTNAILQSQEQLEEIKKGFENESGNKEPSIVIEAHQLILQDKLLLDGSINRLKKEMINAEWAFQKALTDIQSIFDKITDDYLRERRSDVDFVGRRVLRNLLGKNPNITQITEKNSVVVSYDLSPADTLQLLQQNVAALVTEVGAQTSHAAIIARSMEVTAVFGVHGITDWAGHGDPIVVDGYKGEVIIRPYQDEVDVYHARIQRREEWQSDLAKDKDLPATSKDGQQIAMHGNIEFPEEIPGLLYHGAEGIGLYRTEYLFIGRSTPPSEEEHYQTYLQVIKQMQAKPVTIRTIDLGADKLFFGKNFKETNPALGMRAIRYCRENPQVLQQQLSGILRAAMHGDIKIMIPMVSSIEDIHWIKEQIRIVKEQLTQQNVPFPDDIPIGIMIEIPSAVIMAQQLAQEVDFFSIGTNDLIQYSLAVDRTNENIAHLYRPLHPAILRLIHQTVIAAKDNNIHVSVCGEMAGHPLHAALFLALGVDSLSMNGASIPVVKEAIRLLNKSNADELFRDIMACNTYAEISRTMQDRTKLILPEIYEWINY